MQLKSIPYRLFQLFIPIPNWLTRAKFELSSLVFEWTNIRKCLVFGGHCLRLSNFKTIWIFFYNKTFRCNRDINFLKSMYPPKSSNILSQRKNFVWPVRKQFRNPYSYAFLFVCFQSTDHLPIIPSGGPCSNLLLAQPHSNLAQPRYKPPLSLSSQKKFKISAEELVRLQKRRRTKNKRARSAVKI